MNRLEQLLYNLVAINSINPDLVPGGAGEAQIANFIAGWLKDAGVEVHIEEVRPGRPNVVGIVPGTRRGRTLLLNGHVDTVGIEGMPASASRPSIRDGRLYGRGAYDMKCGLAACMLAMAEARQNPPGGDLIFSGVMDEEYAGLGTQDLVKRYHADGAIIAEPTEMQLILAHRGFAWMEIETIGVAAHGSRPDLGVDAIAKMGGVLTALEALDQKLRSRPSHKYLKSGSLHASLIQGGQDLASYPQRCILSIERRTIPGESAASVQMELQEIVDQISRSDPSFNAVVRQGVVRPPLETPEDAEIVQITRETAEALSKQKVEMVGAPYWTDAATLWANGIPTILFGPSGAGAHAAEEWVDLKSVETCARIYLETALKFCQ